MCYMSCSHSYLIVEAYPDSDYETDVLWMGIMYAEGSSTSSSGIQCNAYRQLYDYDSLR